MLHTSTFVIRYSFEISFFTFTAVWSGIPLFTSAHSTLASSAICCDSSLARHCWFRYMHQDKHCDCNCMTFFTLTLLSYMRTKYLSDILICRYMCHDTLKVHGITLCRVAVILTKNKLDVTT